MIPLVYLSVSKIEKSMLPRILAFQKSCPLQNAIVFSADQLTTVSTVKSKSGKDAQIHQLNYENFIRTMAKMARKYSDKI